MRRSGDWLPESRPIHQMAFALWATGVHDARVLATKLADSEQMTRRQVGSWLNERTNYVINDAISGLAARMPAAARLAAEWTS